MLDITPAISDGPVAPRAHGHGSNAGVPKPTPDRRPVGVQRDSERLQANGPSFGRLSTRRAFALRAHAAIIASAQAKRDDTIMIACGRLNHNASSPFLQRLAGRRRSADGRRRRSRPFWPWRPRLVDRGWFPGGLTRKCTRRRPEDANSNRRVIDPPLRREATRCLRCVQRHNH